MNSILLFIGYSEAMGMCSITRTVQSDGVVRNFAQHFKMMIFFELREVCEWYITLAVYYVHESICKYIQCYELSKLVSNLQMAAWQLKT